MTAELTTFPKFLTSALDELQLLFGFLVEMLKIRYASAVNIYTYIL